MQDAPTHDAPNFAGLLAALAAPARKREQAWSDEDLAQDVATLSYESALRAHARYRPADRENAVLSERLDGALGEATGKFPATAADSSNKERKSASITIRMSKAECDQLHRRAAEAGLTMSAYLRSCALEAEALRAQVKQALAEMRKTGNEGTREQGNKQAETLANEDATEPGSKPQGRGEREAAMQQGSTESRVGRVLLPIRKLGTCFLPRRSS